MSIDNHPEQINRPLSLTSLIKRWSSLPLQIRLTISIVVITIPLLILVAFFYGNKTLTILIVIAGAIAIATATWYTVQQTLQHVRALTETASAIAAGDLERFLTAEYQDEIGRLISVFNNMIAHLREQIGNLEKRIADYSLVLDRHVVQFKTTADVGTAVTRLRNLDDMLNQTVHLISEHFGFYHVGIFTLDDEGEYAILRSSNSEGGQQLLAQNYKSKVGQVGMVGFVANTGEARIAQRVGEDPAFSDNPELPQTRAEMALPLIVSGKTLGVLDVQSTQEVAFSNDDITILSVIASLLAIAIENVRLVEKKPSASESTRQAYEIGLSGWQRLMAENKSEYGYISLDKGEVAPISEETSPESLEAIKTKEAVLSNNGTTLHIPIKIRNDVIGVIRLDKPQTGGRWTPEDITTANTLSVQLGTAVESARLYNDISQRAEREFLISDIATKIGATLQLDSILQTTVRELGKALGHTDVILQLKKS